MWRRVAYLLFFILLPLRVYGGVDDRPYFTDVGQFNYAMFLMKDGDYSSASREFARLIEHFPISKYLPEAQYRMAEAYLLSGRYHDAVDEFRRFVRNFGESPLAEKARARIREAERMLKRENAGVYMPAESYMKDGTHERGMRAVQITYFDWKTYDDMERDFRRLKEAGVDTVILRVFQNRGDRVYPFVVPKSDVGVYFNTTHAPVVSDILARAVELAHRNGLELFAWMTTRHADYGLEHRDDLACKGYDLEEKRITRCRGLDMFNEEVIDHLEALYRDLAVYDIDGILFQDDLVLRHNEGFGRFADSAFRRERGVRLEPESLYIRDSDATVAHYTPLFWEWATWKNRHLLMVAERLKRVVRERNPDVKFAINLMYESVTNPPFGLAWLSQDIEEAVRRGFDYYSIMAYHRQMEEELNKDPEEIRDLIERMVKEVSRIVDKPQKVLIKLQTIDWKTGMPLSNTDVVTLLRRIRELEEVSIAIVPYRANFPFHELGTGEIASIP